MNTPPILLPDVDDFSDLLEYLGEWDHVTMTPRRGEMPPDSPRPEPRYFPEVAPAASAWEREGWRGDGRNEIGPFCSVDMGQLGGPRHRSMAVRATDAVIEAVAPRIVTPDDHLGFKIIGHADGRALVILEHGYIIGSHWLAKIDPATIPPYPYALRDERRSEISEALREGGHRPFRRDLPGGDVEISAKDAPALVALIRADGSVRRSWPDGSVSEDPARA